MMMLINALEGAMIHTSAKRTLMIAKSNNVHIGFLK
jgi:hypothetical protein